MRILGSYSPFLEPRGLDEAFIDMTGFESIYCPAAEVAAKIKGRIEKELNVIASVGIASSKVVANVASDYDKPDGLVEVPPSEEAQFLSSMPVERLPGVGAKTGEVLNRVLGVNTVGALANVSPPVLRRTFGAWGDLLLLWANGRHHSPVSGSASPKSISRETTFAQDMGSRPQLRDILRYLAERVGADLRHEGKRARSMVLKVRYEDFETITRQRTLRVPAAVDGTVFETGAALLDRALEERRKKVRLLGIGVTDLVPNAEQLDLFGNPQKEAESLSLALDRIRDKYGFASMQTGRTFRLGHQIPGERRGFHIEKASPSS